MTPRQPSLDVQLAVTLFGWTWREGWDTWCPPSWPPYAVNARPAEGVWHLLDREGGFWGGEDDRGRPIVPSYRDDAEHTAIIWDWLHTQHTTVTLDLTETPIVCQIAGPQHTGEGTGESLGDALCRATLAYARALTTTPQEG